MTIEELTSPTPGGKPRRIVLIGASLPFQGAEWGGDSRLSTTWYPGNPEASQQVLGPTELPSEWSGEWNRTRMGRAPTIYYDETGTASAIIDPSELWTTLDDFRIASARLRVTWAVRGKSIIGPSATGPQSREKDESFQVVREGRLKTLRAQVTRATDIKWSATFEWLSRGQKQNRVANVRRDDDLALATSAVEQSITALGEIVNGTIQSAKSTIRKSATNLTLGQLEAIANAPLAAVNRALSKLRYNVNQFKRVANIARKLATTPFSVANSVLDFARNTVGIANQFTNEMGRTPVELQSTKSKVADLVRASKYFGNVSTAMQQTAARAAELERRLRFVLVSGAGRGALSVRESATTRQGDIIAIHVCKAGDTPQKVSVKYYGTPDQSDAILRSNRLPLYTPTFRPGLPLIIPALVNAPRAG